LKDLAEAAKSSASSSSFAPVKKDMQDLLLEHQAEIIKVKETGKGICGRCRHRSGCSKCDYEKALKYFLKVQFGQESALVNVASTMEA